ncbi:dual specificity protein phosphatase 5 [Aspergillus lentulus]|uniref:protein-tyrosine-phosphatase n=1 Tax=Aspergillus lentulus TaxID=293939 RepID=A0ABQ0ZV13_ASPLE|nr:dual specificity protein phosphatase 5 [Aspergillus lentulus]KAF4164740.1 hypothetical protein CNMCM6936_008793 [Aspergillus lentulus]GFF42317.1 dual specificity protein phosphatase 5 [Aspergillus lentulus]GFF46511.1 dual specificity protein phosphatase 5 [Aspergillus lentulus]GFF63549.1 dual specificity protein phosphatase 5 [Aspergillus lentulus]GFF65667.1 dual specificity protein phosphatase 5 [Aspergillus lentulus]
MAASFGPPTDVSNDANEHLGKWKSEDKVRIGNDGNDEKETDDKTQEKNKRWEMAFAARVREIVPGLFLGNVEGSYNRDMLRESRINAIVSLTDARWVWWNSITREAGIPEHRHKWVQCADSSTQDLLVHMSDICDFIDQMASPALRSSSTLPVENEHESSDKPREAPPEAVLVHCDLGISRSPTVIIAYLMRKYGLKREDVLTFLQSKQKVKPSANFTRQLEVWEQTGYEVWDNKERTVPKAPYQAFLEDRAALLKRKGLTGNEPLVPLNL